jgi:hypothetical protein
MESLARQQRIAEATATVEDFKRQQNDETTLRMLENEQRIADIKEAKFQEDVARFDHRQALMKQDVATAARWGAMLAQPFQQAFSALISGQMNFGDALIQGFKNLLAQLVSMIIGSGIMFLIGMLLSPLTGGTTGAIFGATGLGSMLGLGGKFGGMVPQDLTPLRMAAGGIVPDTNTDRDVFPALLRRGEEVLTPEDPRNAANGGGGDTIIIQAPMQMLAPPGRAETTRHFQRSVMPILNDIRDRNGSGRFERVIKR